MERTNKRWPRNFLAPLELEHDGYFVPGCHSLGFDGVVYQVAYRSKANLSRALSIFA